MTDERLRAEPCLFVPPHEPFYCRIHADVRLRLTDEQCRRAALRDHSDSEHPHSGKWCPQCVRQGAKWEREATRMDARASTPESETSDA